MIITKAGSDQALFNLGHSARNGKLHSPQPVETKGINNAPAIINAQSVDPVGLGKLQAAKESLNSLGRDINVADKIMQAIGTHIGQMKNELNTIVKNYPPYPPGSEERVKLLKGYSSLRGLIDKLTYPPENSGAQVILRGSGNREEITVKGADGQIKTVKTQPVHTGPNGLDIPTLSKTASHKDVQAAIEQLDQAQGLLKGKSSGLKNDAKAIGGSDAEIATGKISQETRYELTSTAESLAPNAETQIYALLK